MKDIFLMKLFDAISEPSSLELGVLRTRLIEGGRDSFWAYFYYNFFKSKAVSNTHNMNSDI